MAYNPGGGQPPYNQQYPYNAPPPPPPPPPLKGGMSTGVKVALFGCLGLLVVAIIAAIIIAVVMVAMNKNSNTSTNYNTNSSSSNTNSRSISNSNTSSTSNTNSSSSSSSSVVHVASIQLARDKAGDAGDSVDEFRPSDNPMHAVIQLSSFESGTKIRVVLMAVKLDTGEKEVKVGEIEREATSLQNQLDTKFTLPKDWPTGTWRIDAYVNGTLDKSLTFQVAN